MPYSQRQLNGRYSRCLACVDAEFADMPADSGGREAADGLREAFEEIQAEATTQSGAGDTAKVGTGQRSLARFNLKEWRKALARTADAEARKTAGFDEDFPPPRSESDDTLLTKSRAVAPKAVEKKAVFVKRGMESEYVLAGAALVAAFETALGVTNTALSHKGAATGGKASAYRRAAEFFEDLDIYIRNKYRDQPDKINAWNIASHVERTAQKSGEETEEEEPAPDAPES
jgi:hypothetical protein